MVDYEAIIRKLIDDGNESPKVDFKSAADFSNRSKAELARLALAMANTDSEDLENCGYIVLGADRKKLVGGINDLAKDSFCASLPVGLNQYIAPEARLEVKGYQDAKHG